MAVWGAGVALACGLATIGAYNPVVETTAAWHRNNRVDPLQSAKDRLYAPAWARALGYHAFSIGVRARDAKLAGLDLSSLDLRIADLTNANLVGARVTDSWLHGANLSGAKLSRADLTGTSFVGADFTGATFDEAVLTDANFIDANGLTAAQIQSGCGTRHVQATVEGLPRGYWFKLKPCKAVAERLRREQTAAEALAKEARTKAERKAAEKAALAAQQALQAEMESAQRAYAEEQAAAEKRAREQAAHEKLGTPRPQGGPAGEEPAADSLKFEELDVVPFDKSAAISSLGAAAAKVAQTCARSDGISVSGKAIITFAPSGHVEKVGFSNKLQIPLLPECIASSFLSASVPAFTGSAVTVSKSFVTKGPPPAPPPAPGDDNPY